jgi:hypothetical protein
VFEIGDWSLEFGSQEQFTLKKIFLSDILEFGVWSLEIGVWSLEFGFRGLANFPTR